MTSTSLPINLDNYFARIGHTGPVEPTLEVLKAITFLHPLAIPFENLNPFLGLPVGLQLEEINKKLLNQHRGGYCFEQNHLLKAVLESVGFEVRGLAARVLWGRPEGVVSPRSHMLLLVDLEDEQYIADAGFGGLTFTAPLLLKAEVEQQTPLELLRILELSNEFVVEAKINEEWKPVYKFNLQEQLLPDYEVFNYFTATSPLSPFTSNLIVTKPATDGRYVLKNNEYTRHFLDRPSEKKTITDVNELKNLLQYTFNLPLPEHPELNEKLKSITTFLNPSI